MADTAHGTGTYVAAGTYGGASYERYRYQYSAYLTAETQTTVSVTVDIQCNPSSIDFQKTLSSNETTSNIDFYWIARLTATNNTGISPYRNSSTSGWDSQWEALHFYNPRADVGLNGSSYTDTENANFHFSFRASFTKNTSARDETFNIYVGMSSSPSSTPTVNSTANFTITIPERTKYAVTYNANNGSGTISPNPDYKYHDITLTLASSGFIRNLYRLVSWNTQANGSGSTYNLGGSYIANQITTLYAQWQYLYVKPKIKEITAIRVSSASATTQSEEGRYIRVSFKYSSAVYDGNLQSTSYSIKINGSTPTSGSVSGTLTNSSDGSFTTSVNCYTTGGYSENETHTVTVTLSNTMSGVSEPFTTSQSTSVSTAIYPMDILETGKSMGIMMPAQTGWYLSVPNVAIQLGAQEGLYTALSSLGWLTEVTTTKDYSTS